MNALNPEQMQAVLAALEDAADYRRDQGDCTFCTIGALAGTGKCDDHASDDAIASMYDLLHEELQGAVAP